MNENTKTGPKDVFLQLLSILGLYAGVVALGSLIFQIIDLYFPDELAYQYGRYISEGLKWPLSVLVVVFPAYVGLSYFVQKDVAMNPEKRELKTRKWLIYFTLSLAAVVIAGDLVSLIYTYLNGEITARFVLKVFAVFAIAASVFTYYLWYLRKDTMATKDPQMKLFVYAVVAVVVAFAIFGFYIAGSPQAARLQRFDDARVNHLQILQSQIVEYWRLKGELPASLLGLRDDISGFVPPVDPQTKSSYEYSVIAALSFELCATFSVASVDETSGVVPRAIYEPYGYSESWAHDAGRACFERTIDPERYSPVVGKTF